MNNDAFARAFDEAERGEVDKGLWARAFAEKGGDERATKARYVELRAAELSAQEGQPSHDPVSTGFAPPPIPDASPPTPPIAPQLSPATPERAPENEAPDSEGWDASPRPWRRFWARTIDNTLYIIAGVLVIAIIAEVLRLNGLVDFMTNPIVLPFLLLPLAMAFEGAFAAMGIRPPGKALLNLRVRHGETGRRLDFNATAYRMINVWLRGMWMGLPLISLLGMAFAAGHLRKHGITSYDKSLGFVVEAKEMGPVRVLTVVAIIFAIFFLAGIGRVLEGKM